MNTLEKLCRRLGCSLETSDLLVLALTHRSVSGSKNNERLEFLGDAILNFYIAEALYERFPEAREGKLSRLRAALVKGATLAEIARELDLGDYIRLGPGELKSGGFRRDSILANTVEAILGAIYLEAGPEHCKKCVLAWYRERLDQLSPSHHSKDPKTRLQEYLQARKQPLPVYEVVNIEGDAHDQTFLVSCSVAILPEPVNGTGSSRRLAEQHAATLALAQIDE